SPTMISTRPSRSGFSASAPTAAAPTAATATPAPMVPRPAAIAADSNAHWATPESTAAALTASAAPDEPMRTTRRIGARATAPRIEMVTRWRSLRMSRLTRLQVLEGERPPVRRRRQGRERAPSAFEEADEEFEQHETGRLDADDEPLERQDERVAGEDDDPEAGPARGLGQPDDSRRKSSVRESERPDAREGDGVDEKLHDFLDEFRRRHCAGLGPAALRDRRGAGGEPERPAQCPPQRGRPEERRQDRQIGGGEAGVVREP